MNDAENEAVNYTIGNLQLAGLFARLVDMQAENDALTCETEDLRARVEQLEREALCK